MNLTQLKAAIVTELKGRTDMTAIIAQTIQSVVLSEHASFDFVKDQVQVVKDYGASNAFQSSNYISDYPLIRKIDSASIIDGATFTGTSSITPLDPWNPRNILDEGVFNRVNYWYVAGDNLNIRAAFPFEYLYLTYFSYPDISDATFNSWIVRDIPYYIVHKVAAKIMAANLGKLDEAKGQYALASAHFPAVAEQMAGA